MVYLFENNGLASKELISFCESFDHNFLEINTQVRDYERNHDLYFFASLINPKLERIICSSAFTTIMPYAASASFGKLRRDERDGEHFKQLEYFSWLLYESVAYRKIHQLKPLTIEINYLGYDFLKDLKAKYFGPDTIDYLKLMFRQSEGFIILNLYEDFKLINTIKTEEDLCLNSLDLDE